MIYHYVNILSDDDDEGGDDDDDGDEGGEVMMVMMVMEVMMMCCQVNEELQVVMFGRTDDQMSVTEQARLYAEP